MGDTIGLALNIQPDLRPLGTSGSDVTTLSNSKPITDTNGSKTIVGETNTSSGGFWDFAQNLAEKTNITGLINRYADGKISKEIINDGVPLYTTTGNPSDQPGGKLLADIAETEKNNTRTYLLIGGTIAALTIIILVTRGK